MNTRTQLYLAFGTQVLLAAALGVGVLLGMAEVRRQFSLVAEYDAPIIANARHLSKLVVDMETGQRGFCITQKEEFLAPYTAGIKAFDALVEKEKRRYAKAGIRDDDRGGQIEALERI